MNERLNEMKEKFKRELLRSTDQHLRQMDQQRQLD